jgi:hypothetical protein
MKYYGEDNIEYALTLHNLCYILEKLGEYKKSKVGYLRVFEIEMKL